MEKILKLIFTIAGAGVGLFFLWTEADYLLTASYDVAVGAGAQQEAARLTFTRLLRAAEHVLLFGTLVLLPLMSSLGNILWHDMYSALVVLVFSGLCMLAAQLIHTSVIDGYVFYLSQNKRWLDLAWPAAVLIIVVGNWLMAFAEMYRVVKVGGR